MGVTVSTPGFDLRACASQPLLFICLQVCAVSSLGSTTKAAFPALGGGASTVFVL